MLVQSPFAAIAAKPLPAVFSGPLLSSGHSGPQRIAMDASMAIFLDMREVMNAWQENEDEKDDGWIIRRTVFLDALLPPTIFIEQIGDVFSSNDLLDLTRLEALIGRSCATHGSKFELVVTKLSRVLQSLPDYKSERFGAQSANARDHYSYIGSGFRNLRALRQVHQ